MYGIAITGATTVGVGGYVFDKAVEQNPGTLVLGPRFFHWQVSACDHGYALAPVDDAGTHYRHLMVQRSCSLGRLVSQTGFWLRPLRKLACCLLEVIASFVRLCVMVTLRQRLCPGKMTHIFRCAMPFQQDPNAFSTQRKESRYLARSLLRGEL